MIRLTPPVMLVLAALGIGLGCRGGQQGGAESADTTGGSAQPSGGQATLYERLGGERAIRAVVKDVIQRAANDPEVNFVRRGRPRQWEPTPKNTRLLERRLVQFIGMNTGGPQRYEGQDMVQAHAGMQITDAEFDAFAGHLRATLDSLQVPQKERDELLQIVSETRPQIVNQ